MIKRISGNKKEYGYPIMEDDENMIIDRNKAELMAQTFVMVHIGDLRNEEKGRERINNSEKHRSTALCRALLS